MSRRTRSVPEGSEEGVSALIKLDMALAARAVYGALEDQVGPHPLPRLLHALVTAAHERSAVGFNVILQQMMTGRIPPELIVDIYLPETARQLGEAWLADELRFTDVTIAASRIQAALRRLDPIWQDHSPLGLRPACLVVSRFGAQHTLGPTLIASQMRRRGVSVELVYGVTPDDLEALAQKKHYNAIFISATGCDELDTLRDLVQHAQKISQSAPVVIGGSALDEYPQLQRDTGADFVTSDLNEALQYCGILTPFPYDPERLHAPSAPGREMSTL